MVEVLKYQTIETPLVTVNIDEKKIDIKGSSNLLDPAGFYEDLSGLVEKYIDVFKNYIALNFYIEYMNTASTKWMFYVMKNMQVKYYGKKIITINWFFEEDDEIIKETGEILKGLLKIPFNIIELRD
ncbi:MAG: SiaC family regulatory phosphoprotein [Bacteroidales bacterium]|nr:SiaC family regulatory phosphoprotein [Bacteroidales bacterium]